MTRRPPPAQQPVAACADGLQVNGLACRRGQRLLFSGLHLHLAPRELLWLKGHNGSGKTSLLRILAGLSAPAQGQVLLDGAPLHQGVAAAGRGIVYIGHAAGLKDDLSLVEAVAFMARLQGLPQADIRAATALQRLGLAAQAGLPVRRLSQGQRRRGALARLALTESPDLWLLDEPFDALDDHSVTQLVRLLTQHAARGGLVLFTSHQAVPLPQASVLHLNPEAERGQGHGQASASLSGALSGPLSDPLSKGASSPWA